MGIIRLLLAVAVVSVHTKGGISIFPFFGNSGVTPVMMFYAISGFYMAMVINEKYAEDTIYFYKKRALRLMPVYWIILIPTILLALLYTVFVNPISLFSSVLNEADLLKSASILLLNVFPVGADMVSLSTMESGGTSSGLYFTPVIWSIGSEITFYLLSPFFIRSRARTIIVFAVFVSVRIGVYALYDFQWTPWLYFFPAATFPFFIMGALAYQWLRPIAKRVTKALDTKLLFKVLALSIFPVLIVMHQWLPLNDTVLIVLFALTIPTLFELTKTNRFDRMIGELSYPLYIAHSAVILFWAPFRHVLPVEAKFIWVLTAGILVSLIALKAEALILRTIRTSRQSKNAVQAHK
ncbi:MAG: acyltransferase [Pseudomonadota bacterium]